MNYEHFNRIVIEHRNTLVLIGILVLLFALLGVLAVEFYVKKELNCKCFKLGKIRISPTSLMLIPILVILIIFPMKIIKCNLDIKETSYEEYVGKIEYSSSSVKFHNADFSVFVGKGHEVVPPGTHKGKVIISQRSKVIVYYESLE